jgi:hypothetical protein
VRGAAGFLAAGERVAAAIAAVAVSLSILAGMNQLAERYAREALDSAPGKIIACLRSLA